MSWLDKLRNLLGGRKETVAIESQVPSIPSQVPTIESEIEPVPTEYASIEKDSYQLGLAAGYTGKSIKDIESSLNRIETQMATKDWVNNKMQEQYLAIMEFLRKHEENEQKRFELLGTSGGMASSTIPKLQAIGSVILSQEIPLSPRMEQALKIIHESREISFENLAFKLATNIEDVRGLLSEMSRRTKLIERFKISRRGWVRYKGEN